MTADELVEAVNKSWREHIAKRDPNCKCMICFGWLEDQLAESKQREATLTLERDAARNALETADKALESSVSALSWLAPDSGPIRKRAAEVILEIREARLKLSDPPAALSERDRAIERKTVITCLHRISSKMGRRESNYLMANLVLQTVLDELIREFNLNPKPETPIT